MCDAHQQLCTPFATLDDAFADCIKSAQPGEQLLFSPAGASFDLFKNYQERGEYFKKLVNGIESKQA
jgi:UDP-N-acetylmuramoylalanine--D-glutamate ligase